jgi:hypothetical protein
MLMEFCNSYAAGNEKRKCEVNDATVLAGRVSIEKYP